MVWRIASGEGGVTRARLWGAPGGSQDLCGPRFVGIIHVVDEVGMRVPSLRARSHWPW